MRGCAGSILLFLLLLVSAAGRAGESETPTRLAAFSEAGGVLPASWEPLTFAKIERKTHYEVVQETGSGTFVVQATAQASASGLIHRCNVDLHERPWLRWRWKVENVLQGGDARRKDGDDYAARVYLTFAPAEDELSFFERAALGLARRLYGDVPSRAINYIWASRLPREQSVDSAYVGRFVKLLAVESGPAEAGVWRSVERNVAADYRRLSGSDPPAVVGVALMTDADDTGERVRAWYGDVGFYARSSSADPGPSR